MGKNTIIITIMIIIIIGSLPQVTRYARLLANGEQHVASPSNLSALSSLCQHMLLVVRDKNTQSVYAITKPMIFYDKCHFSNAAITVRLISEAELI